MHFVQHLLGAGGGINAATGTRYLADDGVACLVYLGQRKAQAIKVRDFFEAWIREISPTDLPCTFEQMSNQRPFAQQCPVIFCPAELKHLRCEKQRRIRHPARYDHVSIGAQSLYDPFGAQVGIGRLCKRCVNHALLVQPKCIQPAPGGLYHLWPPMFAGSKGAKAFCLKNPCCPVRLLIFAPILRSTTKSARHCYTKLKRDFIANACH